MSYIIASYPRSGSTYLRFVIANLLRPDIEHDFDSVNKTIPAIDDKANMKDSIERPIFYKSHSLRNCQNIIYLHRHVGDVLISEYWYKQKFHKEDITLYEWIIHNDYGINWRASVNHYYPTDIHISYDELSSPVIIYDRLPKIGDKTESDWQVAIGKSTFNRMQDAEQKGFGIYPKGDEQIKFIRKGTSGQWKELDQQTQDRIVDKNYSELKILGYL